jgi:D-alanyl-D-alanine dipeptidase
LHAGTGVKRAACVLFLALATTAVAAGADTPPTISPARTMAEAGMVDIRSLVPDMAENIHYAGNDNFTGAPVPGYRAAK